MAYEDKLVKLQKIASALQKITADDPELKLSVLNSEDSSEDGFSVIAVIRYEKSSATEIL